MASMQTLLTLHLASRGTCLGPEPRIWHPWSCPEVSEHATVLVGVRLYKCGQETGGGCRLLSTWFLAPMNRRGPGLLHTCLQVFLVLSTGYVFSWRGGQLLFVYYLTFLSPHSGCISLIHTHTHTCTHTHLYIYSMYMRIYIYIYMAYTGEYICIWHSYEYIYIYVKWMIRLYCVDIPYI